MTALKITIPYDSYDYISNHPECILPYLRERISVLLKANVTGEKFDDFEFVIIRRQETKINLDWIKPELLQCLKK